MKGCFSITIFLCLSLWLTAQNIQPAKVVSQGFATYADRGVVGLFSNQAGLHAVQKTAVSASVIQRYFNEGVLELHLGGAFSLGQYTGGGIYVRRFGDDVFSEQTAGLAIGRRLFENFALGIALETYQLSIENYGNEVQFNSQLGFQADISKTVHIASHLFLPLQQEELLTYSNQAIINIDVAVEAEEHITLKGGLRKITDQDFGVKAAINYRPADKIEIHVGILSYPAHYTFGAGMDIFKDFQALVMGFYQQDLGWSSGINLSYAPRK
jgi:hypothetical protein